MTAARRGSGRSGGQRQHPEHQPQDPGEDQRGAAALLALAIAVPLATEGTSTAPKTVTGRFLATYTGAGANGTPTMVRIEAGTDASGAVQFGYYQQANLNDPNSTSVAVVDSVEFFRAASRAKAARASTTATSRSPVPPGRTASRDRRAALASPPGRRSHAPGRDRALGGGCAAVPDGETRSRGVPGELIRLFASWTAVSRRRVPARANRPCRCLLAPDIGRPVLEGLASTA